MSAVDKALMVVIVRARDKVDDELWDEGLKALYSALEEDKRLIRAAERERCAKECEQLPPYTWADGSDQWGNPCLAKIVARPHDYAAAIRALKDEPDKE